MKTDPILDEVHRVRDEYAARFSFDPVAIVRDLQVHQAGLGRELVAFGPKPAKALDPAPESASHQSEE